MDNDKEFITLWGAKIMCHLKPIMMKKLGKIPYPTATQHCEEGVANGWH
jgi:hypothetical protein